MLQRVGSGADTGLVAVIALQAASVPDAVPQAAQPLEQPAMSGEAPAEFALVDEFAEPLEAAPQAPIVQRIAAAEPCAEPPQPDAAVADAEPSPYVEAVADEPAVLPLEMPPRLDYHAPDYPAPDEPTRLHPLRFIWKMDADGRFSLDQTNSPV